jgi:hypothetical protein
MAAGASPLLLALARQPELVIMPLSDDVRGLLAFSATCRAARAAVASSFIWKRLCVQERVYDSRAGVCSADTVVREDTQIAGSPPPEKKKP